VEAERSGRPAVDDEVVAGAAADHERRLRQAKHAAAARSIT
jgi:hypothetical protein